MKIIERNNDKLILDILDAIFLIICAIFDWIIKRIDKPERLCSNCKYHSIRLNPYPFIKSDLYCSKKNVGVDTEYKDIMSCKLHEFL